MWDRIKAALLWVYEWITVLVGILVGIAATFAPVFDFVAGLDLSQFSFLTPEQALLITSGTAFLKATAVVLQKLYGLMTGDAAEEPIE